MENQKSNNNGILKALVAILALALIGSIVYIFQLKSKETELQTEVTTVKSEKEKVISELEELKTSYDKAIAENTTMNDELIAEREKVVSLMEQIKKAKGNNVDISKYKQQIATLQTKMNDLLKQVDVLKQENQTLTTNLDSTKVILEDSKKYNQELVSQNEDMAKTIEKGAKLSVLNLQTATYKVKGSGKEVATDKASRVELMRISFTIAENNIAKQGDKMYYVQIIDPKNNVIGDKSATSFDGKNLTYSFTSTVKYENKTVNVTKDLNGKDFEPGTYFVNIFDKGELVSKSSFTLR